MIGLEISRCLRNACVTYDSFSSEQIFQESMCHTIVMVRALDEQCTVIEINVS